MSVELTLVDKLNNNISANEKRYTYDVAISGNYPEGGYLVDEESFEGDENDFSKFKAILFLNGSAFDEDGNRYLIDSVDNSDSDNPSFRLRVFEKETGELTETEVATAQNFSGSCKILIEGIIKDGVV